MKTSDYNVMAIGNEVLINVPPSWLLIGKIVAMDDETVTLSPAAYCESIESGHSIFSLCEPGKSNPVSKSWPIPVHQVKRDAIFMASPVDHARFVETIGAKYIAALDKVV